MLVCQIYKTNKPSKTEMVVMTPNRFWCQGIKQIILKNEYSNLSVHFSHSLSRMAELIRLNPEIKVILTDEYGDDENIADWLMFCDWVRFVCPKLKMVLLRHTDRPGLDISSHRQKHGYLNMTSPISRFEGVFRDILNGRLASAEIPHLRGGLTPRELYILKCLCHAEPPVILGERLGIAVKTISAHKSMALRKLGLKRLAPLLGHYQGLIAAQEYIVNQYCPE